MIVISWASGMSSSYWSRLSASISFLLLSEPWASYHGCPAVLSVPTSILLILAVCSKNRFVEAMTNAEKKQSCASLQECRNRPAIVGSVLAVLSFPNRVFIINSQCLEIMLWTNCQSHCINWIPCALVVKKLQNQEKQCSCVSYIIPHLYIPFMY